MKFGEKLDVLTHDRLCELLEYNSETGLFTWKVNRRGARGKAKVGVVAGQIDRNGHRIIGVDRYAYMAHRLAWFYSSEEWPVNEIDHINMCPDDNRLINLRVVPARTFQRANQGVRKDSSTGLKGITRNGRRWTARITKDGRKRILGTFDTPELAHASYVQEAKKLFGSFARAA